MVRAVIVLLVALYAVGSDADAQGYHYPQPQPEFKFPGQDTAGSVGSSQPQNSNGGVYFKQQGLQTQGTAQANTGKDAFSSLGSANVFKQQVAGLASNQITANQADSLTLLVPIQSQSVSNGAQGSRGQADYSGNTAANNFGGQRDFQQNSINLLPLGPAAQQQTVSFAANAGSSSQFVRGQDQYGASGKTQVSQSSSSGQGFSQIQQNSVSIASALQQSANIVSSSQAARGQGQYGQSTQAQGGQSIQQFSAPKQVQFQSQQQSFNIIGSSPAPQQIASFSGNAAASSQFTRGQEQYGDSAKSQVTTFSQSSTVVKAAQPAQQQQTFINVASAPAVTNFVSSSQVARGQGEYGNAAAAQTGQSIQTSTGSKTAQLGGQQSFNVLTSAPAQQPFPAFPGSTATSSQAVRAQNQYGNSASSQGGSSLQSFTTSKVVQSVSQQQLFNAGAQSSVQQFSATNVASASASGREQGNYGGPGKAQAAQSFQSFLAPNALNSQQSVSVGQNQNAVSFQRETSASPAPGQGNRAQTSYSDGGKTQGAFSNLAPSSNVGPTSQAGFGITTVTSAVRGQSQQFNSASFAQGNSQVGNSGAAKTSSGGSSQGGYSYPSPASASNSQSSQYGSTGSQAPPVSPVLASLTPQGPPSQSFFPAQPLAPLPPAPPAPPANIPVSPLPVAPYPAPSSTLSLFPAIPLPAPVGSLPVAPVVAEPIVEEGDYSAIPGEPDKDYPILASIPASDFSCSSQQFPGYYADVSARCQVFHVCWDNRQWSFLCPNGTIFSQQQFVCVWWQDFDCQQAPSLYNLNQNLYVTPLPSVQQQQTVQTSQNQGFGTGPVPSFVNGASQQGPGAQGGLPLAASIAEATQGVLLSQQYLPPSTQQGGYQNQGSQTNPSHGSAGNQQGPLRPPALAASVVEQPQPVSTQNNLLSQQYLPPSSQQGGYQNQGSQSNPSIGNAGNQQGLLQAPALAAAVVEQPQQAPAQAGSGSYGGSLTSGGNQNNGQSFQAANIQTAPLVLELAPSRPSPTISPVVAAPDTGYLPPQSGAVKY